MPVPSNHVILLSRLRIHGSVLFKALNDVCPASWVGKEFPYRIHPLTFPFILVQELVSLLRIYRDTKTTSLVVVVQFISLDTIPAYIFRILTHCRIVLYSIGQDVLGDMSGVQRAFLVWAIKRADGVLCVNRSIQERIYSLCAVTPEILPTAFVSINSDRRTEKEFDIATVGALTSIKAQNLLIESCAYLERPVKIVIVGDGPLRSSLVGLSKEYEEHEITFLGQLSHEEVHLVLQKARMYVSCSRYEGVPSSILEAIWNGLPVISVPGGYAVDLKQLYDFRLLLAEDYTAASLASALNFALKNYEKLIMDTLKNKEALQRYSQSWATKARRVICDHSEISELPGTKRIVPPR